MRSSRDVTFFTPNRSELALLSGLPTETLAEIEIAARKLLAAGIRAVIATLGSDGVLLVTKTEARHIPTVPVKPLDTTGAGDAFIGSFAHFYALSGRCRRCAALGGALCGALGDAAVGRRSRTWMRRRFASSAPSRADCAPAT